MKRIALALFLSLAATAALAQGVTTTGGVTREACATPTATFTSQADAETWAQDFFGTTNTGRATNTTLPFVSDAKNTKGFHGVVAPTCIARGSFTTANFKEYARLKYNQLVTANAAGNGYVASDRAGVSQLSDPTNLTYFNSDQIHPTDAGYVTMYPVDEAAINAAFV